VPLELTTGRWRTRRLIWRFPVALFLLTLDRVVGKPITERAFVLRVTRDDVRHLVVANEDVVRREDSEGLRDCHGASARLGASGMSAERARFIVGTDPLYQHNGHAFIDSFDVGARVAPMVVRFGDRIEVNRSHGACSTNLV
jgi:hypothetical protein